MSGAREWLARLERAWRWTDAHIARHDDDVLYTQHHASFSPVAWHWGHGAAVDARWLLEHARGLDTLDARTREVFTPESTPKHLRAERLPSRTELETIVRIVRDRVRECFAREVRDGDARLIAQVVMHHAQHREIATYVLAVAGRAGEATWTRASTDWSSREPGVCEMVACTYERGARDVIASYDNERDAHLVACGPFAIERCAVSNARYAAFVEGDGYARREWWSDEGWAWKGARTRPTYWGEHWREVLDPARPVERLTAWEAEAFAKWKGGRLPTEIEWECAARWDALGNCTRNEPWGDAPSEPSRVAIERWDEGSVAVAAMRSGDSASAVRGMLGNGWEWTSTPFAPYAGFAPWPYDGYSTPWFDGRHRVLRGGSWASDRTTVRASFRNWYEPHVTEVFAGVRVAYDR